LFSTTIKKIKILKIYVRPASLLMIKIWLLVQKGLKTIALWCPACTTEGWIKNSGGEASGRGDERQ
jgi:hypothetical protein